MSRWTVGVWLALILLSGCSERARERPLASFDSSDGFTRVSSGGIVAPGSGDPPHLSCTTPGDGTPVVVVNSRPYDPPLDFTKRFLKVRVRVDDVMRLSGLEFHLFSDADRTQAFVLAIPLFEDEEANLLQDGEWSTVTLSPGAARRVGTPDLGAIREIVWLVADNGSTESPTPVRADWSELAAVDATRGVVTLTFDDGYDEHYSVAAKLMAEHGLRGTAYVTPDRVGEPGYMKLEEVHALHDRYGWDVAAHHQDPFTGFQADDLHWVIWETRGFLDHEGFAAAEHLAYPLGKYETRTVLPLVRRYFTTARLASGGPETLPPGDPYRLRAMNVLSTTEPEEILAAAQRADSTGEWLILMFHFLVAVPQRDTEYPLEKFTRTVELLAEARVDVRPLSEVWKEYGSSPAPPGR
jgi:hypothetical protein